MVSSLWWVYIAQFGIGSFLLTRWQITMEDLQTVEHVCRKDPKVIEQCVISGVPAEDMHKVYCDRKLSNFSGNFKQDSF